MADPTQSPTLSLDDAASSLTEVGRRFYARNWVLGTSGNFSAVTSRRPLRLAITPSSAHKGLLQPSAFLEIDRTAKVVGHAVGRPSAETLLHLEIVQAREAGAVLHTHSVWSTILSDRHASAGGFEITGFEMLKGLDGVQTHEHREWLRILPNDQDMTRLAKVVRTTLRRHPGAHAFLLQRHGLYTWGRTIADAERQIEILEFLFETLGRSEAPMAIVKIPDEHRAIHDRGEMQAFLAARGIDYERTDNVEIAPGASAAEVLDAHKAKLDELKARGGYVTADVIDVFPTTPNLDAMLNRFNAEHWHDEDEIRFIVEGRGLFHIHPPEGPVFAIEVEAGDLIRVPRGTHHWFDLCSDRRIRAIRLFQDPSGWTPHYTQTGVDRRFQPVCFGPAYFPRVPPAGM